MLGKWVYKCLVVALVPMISMGISLASQCPDAKLISYETKIDGHFEAKLADGIVWQSSSMANLTSAAPIEYSGAVAFGDKNDAQLRCSYHAGPNSFQLAIKQHAALGEGWLKLREKLYICSKASNCNFSLNN